MREGKAALYRWLETTGVSNVTELNRLLERAHPWTDFVASDNA